MVEIRSPIIIIIELLAGLIANILQSFALIYTKLVELFVTLGYISGFGPVGFAIALIIGSTVIFFILKFMFGSSKTLLYVFLFYMAVMGMILISLVFV
jgi:hypothetical protein